MQRIRKALRNEKGLTLVELLAVIVILGIIAAIAIPAVGGIIQNSKEDAVKAEAIAILEAAKMYKINTNEPEGDEDWTIDVSVLETENYIESVDFPENAKVNLENDPLTLSATDVKAGDETIDFYNANIEMINEDDDLTIGTAPDTN
ncbi:prepilin-type N-terminal cleavage/methylation domain-containing protein [Salinibacillus xinjiangensis]|uniref:Prepilin-type N-terminal cleavage/methylation domain-containing protein n=1 Tax=Salinibacillus xinjiangensis TaxID=1229268 RepID=A0A6G1X946_9BACI|nr:prepilin-type N-terminal cleavage/methylation domain-containing protein [Salinibacillus xinjiangensis]MRG87494.1 prepilin-type N-terminal cleavage/methylation domain-containing protein [Salinibacillus xinjiangensis]